MENAKKFRRDPKLRLLDQVRQVLQYHHYAYRTEQTYCDWIMRYIRHLVGKTHPRNMSKKEIEAALNHLAVHKRAPPPPESGDNIQISYVCLGAS